MNNDRENGAMLLDRSPLSPASVDGELWSMLAMFKLIYPFAYTPPLLVCDLSFSYFIVVEKKNPDTFILICNVDCDKNLFARSLFFRKKKR